MTVRRWGVETSADQLGHQLRRPGGMRACPTGSAGKGACACDQQVSNTRLVPVRPVEVEEDRMHWKIEHAICALESICAYRLSSKASGRGYGKIGETGPDLRASSAEFDSLRAARVAV